MTATMTTRERAEAKAAELRAFADECDAKDGGPTAEDQARLIAIATEVKDLVKAAKALDESRTASDLIVPVGSMSDVPDSAFKGLGDVLSRSSEGKKPELLEDGRPVNPNGMTFGELFTRSPEYRSFLKQYVRGADGIPASTKGIASAPWTVGYKTLVTGASATSAGAAVRNDLYAPITDLAGERELTVSDLVTRGSTDSDTVEYVRVTSKTNAAAPTAEATATSGASGTKPESAMALEVVSTTVKTIAHWIPITKRAAADAGQVRTLVDAFLRYGLEEELEDQMLTGDGTGENFTGILNTSGIQTTGSAGTDLDAIVDAIRLVRYTGRRRPTGVVFHPNDWYSTGFLLAKDSQGRYLIGDPARGPADLESLWGLRVVVSEGMTENTALVGDFRQAVLWEREGVSVLVADQHSDFFIRNMLVILAELRAAFGVLDPQGFATVTAV